MVREKTLARREPREMEQYEPWNSFREMERMFRDFFTSPLGMRRPRWLTGMETQVIPDVDLRETDKEFILSATLPGMNKEDIDIDITHDTITITGERKHEEEKPGERYHFRQQSYGHFEVSYSLPSEVKSEEAKATYRKGLLEVTMPKAEVSEAHKVRVEEQE